MPKKDEAGTRSSSTKQLPDREQELEIQQSDEIKSISSDSDQTFAVLALNIKRYLGATSVRNMQMGTASKVQYDNQWDLEGTVRQVEQKFSSDLRIIADETTNYETLLKTLVSLERRNFEHRTIIKITKRTYQ